MRQFHRDANVRNELDRQSMKVVIFVGFLLPARSVQVLPEISLLVKQSHADQRKSQIARRLQVVARQHTQSSSENRQALRNPKLRRKIRHQQLAVLDMFPLVPRSLSGKV